MDERRRQTRKEGKRKRLTGEAKIKRDREMRNRYRDLRRSRLSSPDCIFEIGAAYGLTYESVRDIISRKEKETYAQPL